MRDRRLLGLKFRREKVIDGFLVDLYCHALGLCIEIDGGIHDEPEQAGLDAIRTVILEERGLRVVRIRSHAVTRAALEALVRPLMIDLGDTRASNPIRVDE